MNISILGHVCIDKNISENTKYTGVGGPPAFMHKIFAQLPGITTTITAPYGSDFNSYIGNLPLTNDSILDTTLIYENVTKNHVRTQKAHNIENASFSNLQFSNSNKADLVILAPLTPYLDKSHISKFLGLNNAPVVLLPQGYFRDFDTENNVIKREFHEHEEILPLVDFIILSDQDHPDVFTLAEKWSKQDVTVIITQGEKGAIVIEPHKQSYVVDTKAIDEKDVVDSVGSGDIFSASFSYYYAKHKDIPKAVAFANSIAGQCLFFDAEHLIINVDEAMRATEK